MLPNFVDKLVSLPICMNGVVSAAAACHSQLSLSDYLSLFRRSTNDSGKSIKSNFPCRNTERQIFLVGFWEEEQLFEKKIRGLDKIMHIYLRAHQLCWRVVIESLLKLPAIDYDYQLILKHLNTAVAILRIILNFTGNTTMAMEKTIQSECTSVSHHNYIPKCSRTPD